MRQLKQDGAPEIDVKRAVNELKSRKKLLEDKELELAPAVSVFDDFLLRINDSTSFSSNLFIGGYIRSGTHGGAFEASIFLRPKFCNLWWHCRPI